MLRFEEESSSLKTYVPGGSTFPGTSAGALSVTIVFLFHSSAVAGIRQAPKRTRPSTSRPTIQMEFRRAILFRIDNFLSAAPTAQEVMQCPCHPNSGLNGRPLAARQLLSSHR